jgi:hypothetical protein
LRNIVRTILLNGYIIESFARPTADAYLILVRKRDVLGGEARIVLLFADKVSSGLRSRLTGDATQHQAAAVHVSQKIDKNIANRIHHITLGDFYNLLGGDIRTDRIFATNLRHVMDELGHNRLPDSFSGKPDDLLEAYTEECLEFLLECPVRRYGQERRFEPLPDGLALGRNKFNLYFDAKAYGSEFHPSADDIRRFGSYVKDFNTRYRGFVGPISLFLVVSGSFSSDKNAITEKINDFYAECATPMAFVRASDLADAVSECVGADSHRGALNWQRILVPQVFEISRLRKELLRVRKDAIVR